MPRRRGYTKRRRVYRRSGYKKRSVGRRVKRYTRRTRGRRVTSLRSNAIWGPDRRFIKLKFETYYDMSTLVGTANYQSMRFIANSTVDPMSSLGTAQPTGRDQMFTLYNYNTVLGTKVQIYFWNTSTSQNTVKVWIFPSREVTNANYSTTDVSSIPFAKTSMLGSVDGNRQTTRLTSYMSTKKMFGIKNRSIINDPEYREGVATNPDHTWHYEWGAMNLGTANPPDASSILYTVRVLVRWTYYCCFTEPETLALS